MTPEASPQALAAGTSPNTAEESQEDTPDFWFALINETAMAEFLDLSVRSLQQYRYRGGGPKFVKIATKCVKYRRIDGRTWAESLLRSSTSDPGQAAA